MHILLIHQAFASDSQAGGTRHFELATYLVRHGHRVTVIAGPISYMTGRRSTLDSTEHGLDVVWPRVYGGWGPGFVGRLSAFVSFMISSWIAACRIRDVDVIWGTSPPIFQAISAYLTALLRRRPFVLEIRDLWPGFAVEMEVLRNKLLIWLSEGLERLLYRKATRVVVNSPGFSQHVFERSGAQQRLPNVIPNGVDLETFDARLREGNGWPDWDSEKFNVVYAGALGAANGLDVVLAAATVLRDDMEIRFVLIGDGRDKVRLASEARRRGLTNVAFVPAMPKSAMPSVLKRANLCLATLQPLPLFATTYPNKVFDYMAAGRPTIVAIDGVIREVIETAQAGTYVPPGDGAALARAVVHYREHPSLMESHGRHGRCCVEGRFSRQRHGDMLASIFEEVAQPRD